jgi:hypothetical protein
MIAMATRQLDDKRKKFNLAIQKKSVITNMSRYV